MWIHMNSRSLEEGLRGLHFELASTAFEIAKETIIYRQPADEQKQMRDMLDSATLVLGETLDLNRRVIPDISLATTAESLCVLETKRCTVTCRGRVADLSAEEVVFNADTKKLFAQVCFRHH